MKKFLKIAVTVIAVLLVVVLTAPIFLRGKIAELVRTEANAMLVPRLDFERLGISLLRHFPNASLELKGLTLVGVAPFEGGYHRLRRAPLGGGRPLVAAR